MAKASLKIDKSRTKVCKSEPSHAEGDLVVKQIRYLRLSWIRVFLFSLTVLPTAFFSLLLVYWIPQLRRWCFYSYTNSAQAATHYRIISWDDDIEFVKKLQRSIYNYETGESKITSCFINRHLLYAVDESRDTCTALDMPIFKPFNEILQKYGSSYDEQIQNSIKDTYGKCKIDFDVPSYFTLFMKEVLSPFFVFQLYSAAVWFAEEYTIYAIVILVITFVFATINLVMLRISLLKIHKLAFFKNRVSYYTMKGGVETKYEDKSSTKLLPGTVFTIKERMRIPCDCLLLQGQVLMNECSLTGESVPVTKSAIPRNEDVYNVNIHKMFTVYEGTDVLQVNTHQGEARALVIRTGFASARGQLVRGILYPKPHPFKFAREVYYFLLIIVGITLVGFAVTIPPMITADYAAADFTLAVLDLITIAVPPALPAALTVGIGYAIHRLKKQQIDCISPPKTQVAGRVDAVCFDKTGTITYDEMDLKGIRLAPKAQFGEFLEKKENSSKLTADESATLEIIDQALATCHDIAAIGNDVAGDPMELKLVEFTGFKYTQSADREQLFLMKNERGGEYAGLKRFEFNPNLQRMSMVASLDKPSEKRIFVKGAPEVLTELCLPNTIPPDYHECLARYANCGYRILAVCYRNLTSSESNTRLDDLKRVDCERDLTFLGFTVFQNKPKPESKPTIEQLHQADILMKMSTGDNPVTAIAIAKEVSMIPENSNVVIWDIAEEDSKLYIKIKGISESSVSTRVTVPFFDLNITKRELTEEQSNALAVSLRDLAKELPQGKDDEVAFTGRAFAYIYAAVLLMDKKMSSHVLLNALLKSKVYARMQPNHKIRLIEMIQKTKRLVAMVGDGANDCGALKTADVGLALSQAEASISAPFNSKVLNISALITVLREGRCTLATNFHNFKFMALYSMCQFTATVLSYTQLTNLGNYQFLWEDLVINLPLFLVLGFTKPYPRLTKEMPGDSLFTPRCLISVLGNIAIEVVAGVTILFTLKAQDFYFASSNLNIDEGPNTNGQENGCVWLCSSTLMVYAGLVFADGKPWRKPVYTNIPFTVGLFVTYALVWFLMIDDVPRQAIFEIPSEIPGYFYAVMFGIINGFGILMLVWEWVLVPPIARCISRCCTRRSKVQLLENDLDAPLHQDMDGKLVAQVQVGSA